MQIRIRMEHILDNFREKVQALLDSDPQWLDAMKDWTLMVKLYAEERYDPVIDQLPGRFTPLDGVQIGMNGLHSTSHRCMIMR